MQNSVSSNHCLQNLQMDWRPRLLHYIKSAKLPQAKVSRFILTDMMSNNKRCFKNIFLVRKQWSLKEKVIMTLHNLSMSLEKYCFPLTLQAALSAASLSAWWMARQSLLCLSEFHLYSHCFLLLSVSHAYSPVPEPNWGSVARKDCSAPEIQSSPAMDSRGKRKINPQNKFSNCH